ncbi:Flavin-dependent thymidylate synthase [subsurface metagenome]
METIGTLARLKNWFIEANKIGTPAVELLAYTPEPEKLVAVAARRSYDKRSAKQIWEEMNDIEVPRLLDQVIGHRHLSVLEHANFTFAIEGISRALSHQLVRHRIASYTQQSQQRASEQDFNFIIPPAIQGNLALCREFQEKMRELANFYRKALDMGVTKGQARYALPNACMTRIIMTTNARSLFNLISQRACGVEEWEFRTLAIKMHMILLTVAPNIFKYAGPKCVMDLICPEGEEGKKCGLYKIIPGAVLCDGERKMSATRLQELMKQEAYAIEKHQ